MFQEIKRATQSSIVEVYEVIFLLSSSKEQKALSAMNMCQIGGSTCKQLTLMFVILHHSKKYII